MVSEIPLNEIQLEMASYLLNVDDMNYTMLCEPFDFASRSDAISEIEMQRAPYLLNLDDMNYSMLCEPTIIRYKPGMTSESDFMGLDRITFINGLVCKEGGLESMELIDTTKQMEFPKRKFRQVRPATLEDELAEDSSYSD